MHHEEHSEHEELPVCEEQSKHDNLSEQKRPHVLEESIGKENPSLCAQGCVEKVSPRLALREDWRVRPDRNAERHGGYVHLVEEQKEMKTRLSRASNSTMAGLQGSTFGSDSEDALCGEECELLFDDDAAAAVVPDGAEEEEAREFLRFVADVDRCALFTEDVSREWGDDVSVDGDTSAR